MDFAEPESAERPMLEDAKRYICESGQFQTVQSLAELFGVHVDDLQSRLMGWKSRHEVFSVVGSDERFPIFAFEGTSTLHPKRSIAEVLGIFGDRYSDWFVASWFIASNSYLDGQRPTEVLDDDSGWVIEAARDLVKECSHG